MIGRLKKRREFLAAAKGHKTARRAFVLEALRRDDSAPARFGFTVSKRVAKKAVERNRIRRRLKEAVRMTAADNALAGFDYVLVGRSRALTEPFGEIKVALAEALRQAAGSTTSASEREARRAGR